MKPIKVSELIAILQKKLKEDGDLMVTLPTDTATYTDEEKIGDHEVACVGANTWMSTENGVDVANRICLMDPGMADALG